MSRRIQSIGYGPSETASANQKEEEDALLIEHLPLLLRSVEEIISTPEFFFCQPISAYLSLAYVRGGPLLLGVVALLWKDGTFKLLCPDCGGTVYLIGCGGIILSGTHSCWGVCPTCKAWKHGLHVKCFSEFRMPVQATMQRFPNEPIIIKGETPKFSWSQGLVGETTPDTIVKDKVHGLSLAEVIQRLQDKP